MDKKTLLRILVPMEEQGILKILNAEDKRVVSLSFINFTSFHSPISWFNIQKILLDSSVSFDDPRVDQKVISLKNELKEKKSKYHKNQLVDDVEVEILFPTPKRGKRRYHLLHYFIFYLHGVSSIRLPSLLLQSK